MSKPMFQHHAKPLKTRNPESHTKMSSDSGALDSAYVHEHLGSTPCRLNDAEALRRIEPFHCPSSRRHLLGRLISAAGARTRVSRHNI
jgi:hypothetical protein